MRLRRSGTITCALVLALCAAPSAAYAQTADEAGQGTLEQKAEAVLDEAKDALSAPATAEPTRELTLVLAQLSQLEPALDGRERRVARAILARPDDGASDRYGDGYDRPEAAQSPECDTNFCVHWVNGGQDKPPPADENGIADGDGIPDFVEETLASAQESFAVENGLLGWIEATGDGTRGEDALPSGSDRTDVYLIETNGDYFGYASPDEGQGAIESKEAYLVMDNDMEEFTSPELNELDALRVTMAHEYNHVLQFAYDALVSFRTDLWMYESTATWMEEQVYPAIDDYLGYVPSFARNSRIPLTDNSRDFLKIYGAAVWNHYLNETDVQNAWDMAPDVLPAHRAVGAYDSALGGTGSNPFADIGFRFADFTKQTAEWRATDSIFPDAEDLPNVKRSGRLVPDGRPQKLKLDHLSYALFDVRTDETGLVTLQVRAPEGVRFGIALVGRTGSATGGSSIASGAVDPDGGTTFVGQGTGPFDRLTAVITNADARLNAAGRYTQDDQRFKAKITLP